MQTPPATDRELARALSAGDRAALEALYKRHGAALVAYARAIALERDLAEEAVQQAFIDLWRNPAKLSAADDPKGFLYGVVRLSAFSARRARRRFWRRNAPMPEKDWLVPAPDATEPPRELERLARELAALDEAEREAVVMKCYGDLTFAQMGEAAGISPKTMESRYYNALKKLKERLSRSSL